MMPKRFPYSFEFIWNLNDPSPALKRKQSIDKITEQFYRSEAQYLKSLSWSTLGNRSPAQTWRKQLPKAPISAFGRQTRPPGWKYFFSCSYFGPSLMRFTKLFISSMHSTSNSWKRRPNPKSLRFLKVKRRWCSQNPPSVKKMPFKLKLGSRSRPRRMSLRPSKSCLKSTSLTVCGSLATTVK